MCGEKGLILSHTHPPTSLHPSPTSLVTIATEQEVGIFKGHVAARSILEIVTLSVPIINYVEVTHCAT